MKITSFPEWVGPVFLALAVPASAFGPVVMAIALGIALLAVVPAMEWRPTVDAIRQLAVKSVLARCLVALLLVWLIASLLSIVPLKSLSTLARMIVFLTMAFVVYRYLSARPGSLSLFRRSLLVGMLVVLSYIDMTLYVWPDLIDIVSLVKGQPIAWYSFFKGHGSVVAIFLFCALWAGYREGGGWRGVAVAVALLCALLIYAKGDQTSLSGVAGVIGGLALAAVVALLRTLPPRVGKTGAVLAIALAICSLWLLAQSLPPIDQKVDSTAVPFIDMHRQYIWSFVLHQIPENPIFGVGINAVNMVLGADANVPGMGQEFVPAHPHNWIIEIAAETGLIGLTMLSACQLAFLGHVARLVSRDRWAALTAIACFGAFWSSSMFNFSVWTSWWQVALLIALIGPLAAMSNHSSGRMGVVRPSEAIAGKPE